MITAPSLEWLNCTDSPFQLTLNDYGHSRNMWGWPCAILEQKLVLDFHFSCLLKWVFLALYTTIPFKYWPNSIANCVIMCSLYQVIKLRYINNRSLFLCYQSVWSWVRAKKNKSFVHRKVKDNNITILVSISMIGKICFNTNKWTF